MIKLRKAEERGHFDHGWLDTWHTFSFAGYQDPEHMRFRGLRVINEDFIAPGKGFGTHPHEDMEILTWVLEGALQHRDSMGNGSVIRPEEVQIMSAGTGITHSEFNASKTERTHLLQIWIFPVERGLEPSYGQARLDPETLRGRLCPIATPKAEGGVVTIHADARVLAGRLEAGDRLEHRLEPGRHAWVQVARGSVRLGGEELRQGDGAAIGEQPSVELAAEGPAEVLLFDLA